MTPPAPPAGDAGARARGWGARLRRSTLRSRVIAVLVVALLVGYVTVGVVTEVALRGFLQQQLDQQLGSAARRNVGHVLRGDLTGPGPTGGRGSSAFASVVGQPEGTVGAAILGGTVVSFAVVGSTASYTAARVAIAQLRPHRGPFTHSLPGLGDYRLLVMAGPYDTTVVTGLPQQPVEQTVQRMLLIELVVFAGVLVATGLCAAVFVRLSLRPLNRVAATAERVAGLPLTGGHVQLPAPIPNPAPGTEAGRVADAVNRMIAHVGNALHQRQSSEDRLRRFVADASHELRTPVAVIRGYAEFAERAGGDSLDDEVVHALGRIRAQSGRMTALVEDLLLLARLDSGRPLDRRPVDLTRLVLDAVRDVQMAVPDHTWRLELPDEPVVLTGDEPTLLQSVGNLLANAGRHTPGGTTVLVRLSGDAGEVRLEVTDDGPGIPPDLQPRLFERFVHGATASESTGGYGLGLPIVAAIMHAHGGRVELASGPGATTFRLVLPTS